MQIRSTIRRLSAGLAATAAVTAAVGIAACGSSSGSAGGKNTISVAYGSNYVMATAALAPQYYGQLAKAFEAAHPGVTVKLIPIPGNPNDIITKLGLLYRSPSTAPTIAEIDNLDIGKFASAGYLMPLNKYVASASWWKGFPSVIKNEATFGGNVYGINQGENVQALTYNKLDFAKAGLPVPWHPRTWQDVINAAETIKQKLPNITPMWAEGGTGAGTEGVSLGVANLLAASTDPTVYDTSTKKWVVDSAGLRETFNFIHRLTVDNLNAPVSQLFNPNAPGNAATYQYKPGAAIAIASNYWGPFWLKYQAPLWPASVQDIGVTPLPTYNGGGAGIASLLTGWDNVVYSGAQNPSLAWQFLNFAMQKTQLLTFDNDGLMIPPVTKYTTDPQYVNFGAPFQAEFAKLEPYATEWPDTQNLPVWSEAFQQATGALEQSAGTSVASAIASMKSYVSQQLGSNAVETRP
ncbi:MAG: ABC transporter substrate-binding protein [Solirubrobacteraceae bacterium]